MVDYFFAVKSSNAFVFTREFPLSMCFVTRVETPAINFLSL